MCLTSAVIGHPCTQNLVSWADACVTMSFEFWMNFDCCCWLSVSTRFSCVILVTMAPSPASAAAAQLSSSQKVVAPKGRARPANKGGTATKTLGRPLRHSAESQASAQAAPSVQAKLTDDLAVILADETFTNIEDENPYDIKDCSGEDECHAEDLTAGKQSPFDSDEAKTIL